MGLTEYPPWAWYTDGNTTHCGHERDFQNRGVSIDGNDIDDKLVRTEDTTTSTQNTQRRTTAEAEAG